VDDSDKEVIGHRLKKYLDLSLPIIDHYQTHGILHRIDGTGSVTEVTTAIKRVLASTFKGTLSFNY
jgi:adenylate kinase